MTRGHTDLGTDTVGENCNGFYIIFVFCNWNAPNHPTTRVLLSLHHYPKVISPLTFTTYAFFSASDKLTTLKSNKSFQISDFFCIINIKEFYLEKEVSVYLSLSCSSTKFFSATNFVLCMGPWEIQIGTLDFHSVGMAAGPCSPGSGHNYKGKTSELVIWEEVGQGKWYSTLHCLCQSHHQRFKETSRKTAWSHTLWKT